MPATNDPAVDPHLFLAGRPPMAEFIAFVERGSPASRRSDGPSTARRLADDWRAANDHLRTLEASEAGLADEPRTEPLARELEPLAERLRAEPAFQRCYGMLPCRIAVVELDRLVVFQKQINLSSVERVKAELGPDPSADTVARVMLGLGRYTPPTRMIQGRDAFTFVCDSADFRVIEPIVLSGDAVPRLPCKGRPDRAVVIPVGFSPNCLTVVRIERRLILLNGSHRAYAARELGFRMVPCVLQTISRADEIDVIAERELSQRSDLFLKSARPPLLKDYFDERLRRIVPVVRNHRLLRIQIRVEQSDIPGV